MKKVRFTSIDSTNLVGIWHNSSPDTNKVVVMAHGITVDKDEGGIFIDLANQLDSRGIHSFRFDFRGHGESGGEQADMTILGELKDFESVVNLVKDKGYTSIGLLGASFGGGISALFAPDHQSELSALCLWNPALNYDHTFINPQPSWIKNKITRMKKEIEKQGYTEFGSRKFKFGKNLYQQMYQYQPHLTASKISIPTFLVHGDQDSKVLYTDSVAYEKNLAGPHKILIIKDCEHGFHQPSESKIAIRATIEFFQKYL